MSKHEDLKQHIYLFDMMAEKLGKNLQVAVIDNEISADDVIDAVVRCSDCAKASTCAAALPRADHLKTPFEYCQNQDLFSRVGSENSE